MNQLIQRLEEYYNRSGINVTLEEERNCLSLKQRILTVDGFLNLEIFVIADEGDCTKYQFLCYGLGVLKNATDKDLFRFNLFNENQEEIQICLDEKDEIALTFYREFQDITSYDLGLDTMGEALQCVSMFGPFIKRNYQLLKHIIKCLK